MSRVRIIIADNRQEVLDVLANLLDLLNVETITCRTGEEVLRQIETGPVDAIISDVRMPVMDGMVLAERLRETRPELPLIMMSSYASKALEEEARRRGALGLVAKPFKISAVTELLASAGVEFTQRP